MRCYHFCHSYISGLQAGLQSAHAQTELALKFAGTNPTPVSTMWWSWALDHKTTILLNGGNSAQLLALLKDLTTHHPHIPWASFYEDDDSMNGMLTNIAVIVDEKMQEELTIAKEAMREHETPAPTLLHSMLITCKTMI